MGSTAPKGRRQTHASRKTAVAPSGLWVCFGTGYLGLTPQATCLCPLRGKIPDPRLVYKRVGSRPRLHAWAPSEPSGRPLRFADTLRQRRERVGPCRSGNPAVMPH
jgi:hypothetical protein